MVGRCAGAESRSVVVERLREDLPRLLVLEKVWVRVQVVALIKLAPEPADIANLDQHLPGQFALDGEVYVVIARIEQAWVIEKRQQFAERLVGNHRRFRRRVDRHRDVAVNACTERLAVTVLRPQFGERLREADAEHRNHHRRNRVGAIIGQRIAAANHRLALAEEFAEPAGFERRLPGGGNARRKVFAIDTPSRD